MTDSRETRPDTLEQRAEHLEAMNRDCEPGCEKCRRHRVRAILSALKDARAEMMAEKNAGLLGNTASGEPENKSTPNVCPFCGKEPQPAIPGPMAICGDDPPFPILMCGTCGNKVADFFGRMRERKRADEAEAILKSIAADEPWEFNGDGGGACFYCRAWKDIDPHEDFCPWLLAQPLLQAQDGAIDHGLHSQATTKEPTSDAREEGRRETKDELLLGNTGMGNSDDPPSTSGERHELGPWKVIRTGGITVAQGYECSCGVIGCAQGS
jgi:hypothetical protein